MERESVKIQKEKATRIAGGTIFVICSFLALVTIALLYSTMGPVSIALGLFVGVFLGVIMCVSVDNILIDIIEAKYIEPFNESRPVEKKTIISFRIDEWDNVQVWYLEDSNINSKHCYGVTFKSQSEPGETTVEYRELYDYTWADVVITTSVERFVELTQP